MASCKECVHYDVCEARIADYEDKEENREATPTADVQEVVRCKDCCWSDHLTDTSLRCTNLKVVMPPYGFCCFGENRHAKMDKE